MDFKKEQTSFKYEKEKADLLIEKTGFLKGLKISMVIAVLFFMAIFIGGILLICYSFPFLGVITCVLDFLPLIMSFAFCSYVFTMSKCIKKCQYTVIKSEIQEAKPITGSPYWHTIQTKDGGSLYYFTEEALKEVKPGTIVDTIVCEAKHIIVFSVDPL
jgi:hypothetical protein